MGYFCGISNLILMIWEADKWLGGISGEYCMNIMNVWTFG